jgi:hypothetical protein
MSALALGLLYAPVAWTHGGEEGEEDNVEGDVHAGDMVLGSTAPGGGALAIGFDFFTVVRVSLADVVGSTSLYTAVDPGFDVAEDTSAGVHPLRRGTEIRVEIIGLDEERVAVVLNGTTLARAGDVAVLGTTRAGPQVSPHRHPELQLRLPQPPGEFGEGSLSFRLTTPSPAYAPSKPYTLRISNGHLSAPAHRNGYDARTLRCQKALVRHLWRFARRAARDPQATEAAILARCGPEGSGSYDAHQVRAHLGMVAAHREHLAALVAQAPSPGCRKAMARGLRLFDVHGAQLAACVLRIKALDAMEEGGLPAPSAAVEAACADREGHGPAGATLIGRLARARAVARAAIRRRCDATISGRKFPSTAGCAADDVVSATLEGAKSDLGRYQARPSQGGHSLDAYFRCLAGGTAGNGHAHD